MQTAPTAAKKGVLNNELVTGILADRRRCAKQHILGKKNDDLALTGTATRAKFLEINTRLRSRFDTIAARIALSNQLHVAAVDVARRSGMPL